MLWVAAELTTRSCRSVEYSVGIPEELFPNGQSYLRERSEARRTTRVSFNTCYLKTSDQCPYSLVTTLVRTIDWLKCRIENQLLRSHIQSVAFVPVTYVTGNERT